MKTNSILMDMVSVQSKTNLSANKVRNSNDKNSADFRNIFKEAINNSQSRKEFKSENEKTVSSFKQAAKGKTIAFKSRNEALNTEVSETDGIDSGNKENEKLKENAVLDGISELMGVSKEELMDLLAAAGIQPTELCNQETANAAISKLSDILGLNKQQSDLLKSVVNNINTLVDSTLNQASDGHHASGKDGWVRVQGASIQVITKPDYKELSNVIAGKIHSLVNSVKNDTGTSFDGIMQKIGQITTDGSLQGNKISLDAKNEEFGQSDDDNNEETEKNSDSKESTAVRNSLNESLKPQEIVNSNTQSTHIANNINVSEVSKAFDLNSPERITSEVRIVKNEIMSQVVEKAKVMLDGHKSEMIMELKPESLGKLSLKVVTENGIVMAKFVAENQQVKEVIETNMQLLKDSLEKQGLSIQGFSVSVGQDSDKGANDQYMYKGGSRQSGRGGNETVISGIQAADEQMVRSNPYLATESSVDFRA